MTLEASVRLLRHELLLHGPALTAQVDDRERRVVRAKREVGIDAHLRHDRATLRVLRAVDPRRVDERIGVVALRTLNARADAAVHAAPQIDGPGLVRGMRNLAAVG